MPETKSSHDDGDKSEESRSSRVRATHVKGADATTRDAEEKEAAEQADREAQSERDAGDVEAFLSAHRGEQLLRGPGGSFDHAAYTADRERERVENEQDDSDSGSTP